MTSQTRIALVGFLATAVTFGPGRMAYGMFLPQLRDAFGFGTEAVGAIAGLAFAAFFVALFLTGWLTPRLGARLPVSLAGGFASAGFVLTALSQNLVSMTIGVALASASAGFAWTPFNSMAERAVAPRRQTRVLSIVSTGTTFGIIAAGVLALAVALSGHSWRVAWGAFALMGLALAIAPMLVLTRKEEPDRQARFAPRAVLVRLWTRTAMPLFALAFSFGATNGTYLSYWVEHIARSGGLAGIPTELIGPVLFVAFGLGGAVGLLTGEIEARIGLKTLLLALYATSAASLLLLAFVPDVWAGVVISAATQGVCLMGLSAVYSFWSARLFPDMPSTSFTAVLLVYAAGNVIGPPLAGLVGSALGLGLALAAFGALSLGSMVFVRGVKPA